MRRLKIFCVFNYIFYTFGSRVRAMVFSRNITPSALIFPSLTGHILMTTWMIRSRHIPTLQILLYRNIKYLQGLVINRFPNMSSTMKIAGM